MKSILCGVIGIIVLVLQSAGQGSFRLDNTASAAGFRLHAPGSWYTGGGGIEVWEANSADPAALSAINLSASGVSAYNLLTSLGFTLETTYTGTSLFDSGSVSIWFPVEMPDVRPPGGTVTVALAAWNTPDLTINQELAHASANARLGVHAFMQPTVDYLFHGTVAPSLAWSQGDLVMTLIPEPGVISLVIVGTAILLANSVRAERRRRWD